MLKGVLFYSVPWEYEEQLAAINSKYLQRIADRIGKIGRLSSADIHRLDQLRRYGSDYDEMVSELSTLTNKTKTNIRDLIQAAAKNSYDDAKTVAALKKLPLIPFAENVALQRTIMAIAEQTVGTFMNLSRTSVVGYSVKDATGRMIFKGAGDAYRDAVDMAIHELSIGVTDFPAAMRQTLNSLADSGLRTVDYASGATRRLDSAVRMNILDGVRDVYQGVQDQVGREIGTDGVEISAHGGCAPDHLPYQGRQYSKKEFNAIQDSLERPFGKWNCRHMWHAIILGVSRPAYSEQQLAELRRMSEDTIEFDGKEYTLYEATQLQRKIESAVRQSKDRANMAKAIGDHQTRVTEQLRINRLTQKYKELSNVARLPYKSERMSVSGFHPVKAIDISKAIDNMYSRFGIANVDMSGLSSYVSKKVEKAIADIMTDYPQLVGFIQSLEVDTSRPSIASATINLLNGEIKTSLRINPNLLKDIKSVDKAINDEVSVGFWTKKDGIKGIIEHEMGHMLEYSRAFVEAGVNPFSVNPNDLTLKIRALDTIGKRDISRRTIIQAFANLGLPVNIPTITSELSEYASYNFSETFAEAISDANKKRVSREVIKIIKGWK